MKEIQPNEMNDPHYNNNDNKNSIHQVDNHFTHQSGASYSSISRNASLHYYYHLLRNSIKK